MTPEKSEDGSFLLKILSAKLCILVSFPQVRWRIVPIKSVRWFKMLKDILDAKTLDPVFSLKIAGKLGSALVFAENTYGRDYIKPFFAQAYDLFADDCCPLTSFM